MWKQQSPYARPLTMRLQSKQNIWHQRRGINTRLVFFLMRLIHTNHSCKIFLRCMHILKNIITFDFFFMNVIITKLGEIEWNGELLRFSKLAIKYVKYWLKHIRLIGRFCHYCFGQTLKAVLETEGLFFKYNVHFVQRILNNTGR